MTELLGRLGAVIGISLVLTVLLLVLYQDDKASADTVGLQQASAVTANGTP